ncbi:MAG: tripartite tricarboxylate transporter substrate binding protein [Pigmentiphaga sp.]|nr:tripartite tricarboxylate transporter substrate binding protein [Pigmentiphaga sp.]
MLTKVLVTSLVLGSTLYGSATAQIRTEEGGYPSKPIQLIVPFTPGGATDAIARVASAELSTRLQQSVVVANRAGAGGNIGAEHVAKSPSDGYTLLLGTIATNAINESLYRNLPFSAQDELVPVAPLASLPLVLVTSRPDINTVDDLIRLAKREPGAVTYASPGSGTAGHLASKIFEQVSNITLTHVPYKGSSAGLTDIMAGRVDMSFDTLIAALSQIKAGRLKALAVTTPERVPFMADVPTVAEAGIPDVNISAWNGIFAPTGTPEAIVAGLNKEIRHLLSDPAVEQRILGIGGVVLVQDHKDFAAFVQAEHDKYRALIKRSGISID